MSEELPPDVRRDLHGDAVRLNRQQLWFSLAGLILVAVAVPTAYLIDVVRANFYLGADPYSGRRGIDLGCANLA